MQSAWSRIWTHVAVSIFYDVLKIILTNIGLTLVTRRSAFLLQIYWYNLDPSIQQMGKYEKFYKSLTIRSFVLNSECNFVGH